MSQLVENEVFVVVIKYLGIEEAMGLQRTCRLFAGPLCSKDIRDHIKDLIFIVCSPLQPSVQGLSTQSRNFYWTHESRVEEMKASSPLYYKRLTKANCVYESAILRDVDRTFPHLGFFEKSQQGYRFDRNVLRRHQALFRILKALAIHIEDVGYCQGINFLAATIYLNMGDEESTFWMLVHLLQDEKFKKVFAPGLERFRLACYQLECMVRKNLPRLAYFFVSLWSNPNVR